MNKISKKWGMLVVLLGQCSITYVASNARIELPPADRAVLDNMFAQTKRFYTKSAGLTQSQAHMSVEGIQHKIRTELFGFAANKGIIDQALARETEHKLSHSAFYSAVPFMHLFQDVAREMYKRRVGVLGALKDDAFQFVRYTYNNQAYDQYASIQEFLLKNVKKDGIIDDTMGLGLYLVATNLSLFGSAGMRGDSTWRLFNVPQKWVQVNRAFLAECLESYGFSLKYLDKLMALNEYFKNDKGEMMSDLFQIFIPEKLVNEVGYLCWRSGIPNDTFLTRSPDTKPSKGPYVKEQGYMESVFEQEKIGYNSDRETFQKGLLNFSDRYKAGDAEAKKVVNELLRRIENGTYQLEAFLYKYRTDPAAVKALNYAQARLLITNKVMLNPESGVKIYRYSQLDPAKEAAYKIELERIFHQMDIEKQARDAIRVK
jgi:hypothetical protein